MISPLLLYQSISKLFHFSRRTASKLEHMILDCPGFFPANGDLLFEFVVKGYVRDRTILLEGVKAVKLERNPK